ncbi:hypothetical protein RSOL_206030 [Rhizoctonia solani AG-3 Rhs1AP]|uniref:Uncharacterized protein n=1 Tax=Rhizoctonia solani AG-3 Rhs1AP TaxID=1086054 RepID=X8J4U7_9AGAM|nr:hypothetical protein RSOL_206030 [Rhizoctonia solani AG-3 Rhs1AP]
MHAPLVMQLS